MTGTDLFGAPVPEPTPEVVEEKKHEGLRVRILGFFKDKKYQTFTLKEVQEHFVNNKATAVKRAVDQLMRSGKIIGTGERRGTGDSAHCLTLNLHKRK